MRCRPQSASFCYIALPFISDALAIFGLSFLFPSFWCLTHVKANGATTYDSASQKRGSIALEYFSEIICLLLFSWSFIAIIIFRFFQTYLRHTLSRLLFVQGHSNEECQRVRPLDDALGRLRLLPCNRDVQRCVPALVSLLLRNQALFRVLAAEPIYKRIVNPVQNVHPS